MSLEKVLHETLCRNKKLQISQESVKVLNEINKFEKYKPTCKGNVAYILGIVLIDDANQMCLIQEAKASCRGKWYFPAGRMEKNEDLCMAAKRECVEETGYEIEPVSLCSIELSDACWFRLTFIAVITGGSLKSKADR